MKKGEQFVVIDGDRLYVNKIDGTSFLDLGDCDVKNLKEVIGLENINGINNLRLHLSFNELVNTSGLEDFVGLEGLILRGNKIVEIKGLENLKELRNLDLRVNQIREITGLENMRRLSTLLLDFNQITELKGLEHLESLSNIELGNNNIPSGILMQFMGEKDAQKCVDYCRKANYF